MTWVFVSQRERGERDITIDRDGVRGSRVRCRNTAKKRIRRPEKETILDQ